MDWKWKANGLVEMSGFSLIPQPVNLFLWDLYIRGIVVTFF